MFNERHPLPDRQASPTIRALASIALLLSLTVVVSACSQEDRDAIRENLGTATITQPGGGDEGAESPTPTTAPPDTTTTVEAPPPTEEAPTATTAVGSDEGDGIETSSALLLLAAVVIGALIIFLIGRRSSRPTVSTPVAPVAPGAAPTWQDRSRSVYTEGRWILDNTDQRTVALRAAALAGDPRAVEADREMRRRLDAFMTDVYAVEAVAPTASVRRALRDLGDGARSLDSAVDSMAAAANTASGSSPETAAWSEDRRRFEASLDRLADELRSSGG